MANRKKRRKTRETESSYEKQAAADMRRKVEEAPSLDTLETQLRSRLHQLTIEQADLSRRLHDIKRERLQLEVLLPVIDPLASYQAGIYIDQEALARVANFVDALLNPKKR